MSGTWLTVLHVRKYCPGAPNPGSPPKCTLPQPSNPLISTSRAGENSKHGNVSCPLAPARAASYEHVNFCPACSRHPNVSNPPKRPYAYSPSTTGCPVGASAVEMSISGHATSPPPDSIYPLMPAATSASTTSLPFSKRNERFGRSIVPP